MSLTKRKFLFLGIFGAFSFFLCIVAISCILIYLLTKRNNIESPTESNIYLVSNLDPSTNESSYGFTRINKKISNDQYFSSPNPEKGNTIIISNFFESEYECTGSCFCEEENIRRTTASMFNRGLFLILSAFSVNMAYNIAKETFQHSCEDQLSELCEKTSINSEIYECKEDKSRYEISHEDFSLGADIKDQIQRREYICRGFCLKNSRHIYWDTSVIDLERKNRGIREQRENFGNCEKLELTKTVEFTIDAEETLKKNKNMNVIAKRKFCTLHFNEFCRSQSLVDVKILAASYLNIEGEKIRYFRDDKTSACVAQTSETRGKMPNIKCKLQKKEMFAGK